MATQAARDQARQVGGKAQQVGGKVQEMGGQARQQAQGVLQRLRQNGPGPAGWVALMALVGALVVGAGIVLTLLSPVLLFFSPILVPVAVVLFLATAATVTAGGAGLATLSAASWLYRYLKGRRPRGSDRVDHVLSRVHETTEHVKHRARDVAGQIPTPTAA